MLNRPPTSRLLLACLCLAGSFAGCGGSSSETPPPLSPDPLNDPYRSSADFARKAGSGKTEASDEAAAPEAPTSPAEPAGKNPE